MKYKQGQKDASKSLYSTLPATLETLHAKEASALQSQVKSSRYAAIHTRSCFTFSLLFFPQRKYAEAQKKDLKSTLFHLLPETLDTAHAKDVSELLSQVSFSHRGGGDVSSAPNCKCM